MNRLRRNTGLLPNLLLAILLVSAQASVALHALEHDPGTPQSKVCSTCATASQLASACVDGQFPHELDPPGSSFVAASNSDFRSLRFITARQRGPPAAL